MIIYNKRLRISRKEFYYTLLSLITYDIYQKTGDKPSFIKLEKGYKYSTKTKSKNTKKTIVETHMIKCPEKEYQIIQKKYTEGKMYEMKYELTDDVDGFGVLTFVQTGTDESLLEKAIVKHSFNSRIKSIERFILFKKA